jgi:hypothetical protein
MKSLEQDSKAMAVEDPKVKVGKALLVEGRGRKLFCQGKLDRGIYRHLPYIHIRQ